MPQPDNESCLNCRFAIPIENFKGVMDCRYNAPTPGDGGRRLEVAEGYWCGKWQPTRLGLNVIEDPVIQKERYKKALEDVVKFLVTHPPLPIAALKVVQSALEK